MGADRLFVVVSGLPGSGKSTLAAQLAPLLNLPVIDKDAILERLFETKGVGDAVWRRALSRESDALFQEAASNSEGALLISFWHLPGMPADSGTPMGWLAGLSNRVLNLHCNCTPEIAAERFCRRKRHPGHLDSETPKEQVLASIRAIAQLGRLEMNRRIEVDTSQGQLQLDTLVRAIFDALHDS